MAEHPRYTDTNEPILIGDQVFLSTLEGDSFYTGTIYEIDGDGDAYIDTAESIMSELRWWPSGWRDVEGVTITKIDKPYRLVTIRVSESDWNTTARWPAAANKLDEDLIVKFGYAAVDEIRSQLHIGERDA